MATKCPAGFAWGGNDVSVGNDLALPYQIKQPALVSLVTPAGKADLASTAAVALAVSSNTKARHPDPQLDDPSPGEVGWEDETWLGAFVGAAQQAVARNEPGESRAHACPRIRMVACSQL